MKHQAPGLLSFTNAGMDPGGGGLWGCNPPKALDNQRRIKGSSSAAKALGARTHRTRAQVRRKHYRSVVFYIFVPNCVSAAALHTKH